MAYVPPPTNQQPPRKQMGTFGAVFWGERRRERAVSGQDQLRQHIAKYGEHAPEPVLWDAWEALPALLAELDEAGETADYWRKRAVELGTELEELRSAVEVAVNDLTSGLFDGLTG